MTQPLIRGGCRAALVVLLLTACDKLLPRPPAVRLPTAQEVTSAAQTPTQAPVPPPAAKTAQAKDSAVSAEAAAFDQIRRSLRRLVAVEQT